MVAMVALSSACGSQSAPAARSLITSTTQIAGAGVLGNDRKPDEACAHDAAAADPGPPTRRAPNLAGVSPDVVPVPAEPRRIIVLSGDQLDTLCALGLQSRVAGAALPDGSPDQPSYLGAVVHGLPGVGTRGNPDLGAIAAAHPDLILGTGLTTKWYPQLAAIAPTVLTAAPGAAWEDNVRAVGAATARGGAAGALIEGFKKHATQIGAKHDAAHFQASIVQLTATSVRVYGSANFPASVLTAVGVDRPATQRFTDRAYLEIGASDADLAKGADLSAADADVVYISFATPAARRRAATLLDSDSWRKLSANRDNRVFVVDDEVWQSGQGLIAARGMLGDLRWVNSLIN